MCSLESFAIFSFKQRIQKIGDNYYGDWETLAKIKLDWRRIQSVFYLEVLSTNNKVPDNQNQKEEKFGFRKLNRSKIIALTSFTKHGKEEVQLVEVNSDSDEDVIEEEQTIGNSEDSILKAVETLKDETVEVKIKKLYVHCI